MRRRKRKVFRFVHVKTSKDKWRSRLLILNKPVLGYNSHQLPRAKKRKDYRNIRHLHVVSEKVHIPLDRKYIKYVLSDFKRAAEKRIRRKDKEDKSKNRRV